MGATALFACEDNGVVASSSSSTSTTSANAGGATSSGAGGAGGDTSSVGAGGEGGSAPPPWANYRCTGDDCPPCALNMPPCATDGGVTELIDGTCCAFGDPLPAVGEGHALEAVDIETDGEHSVLCGGFGADVHDVTNPLQPSYLGKAGLRCQRAAFGPTVGGNKSFFVAHHGDSWQTSPYLQTYTIDGGDLVQVANLTEPGVLYEGLASDGSHLFVAAHDGGVRSYAIEPDGSLTHLATLGGFANAWKVELDESFLYVADYDVGLRVVSVADPSNLVMVDTLATTGPPRDVAFGEGRVFAALGGFGVDVFDRSAAGSLTYAATLAVDGTAQAVDADAGVLGVAAWNHVATYDAQSLRLLATEKTRGYPKFEQDLGVAMDGPNLHVAEWEGLYVLRHRPGFIAPDLWIEERLFQFEPNEVGVRAVVVQNRGDLPLSISGITFDDAAYSASPSTLSVAPGSGDFFEIQLQPPVDGDLAIMALATDDPDEFDASFQAGLHAADNSLTLDVGDTLTNAFSFLDPGGQLSNLQGQVTVLAYFALF